MRKAIIFMMSIFLVLAGADAFAKKSKKKKKGKKKTNKEITVAPKSDQIKPMIEGFKWGMTHEEVANILAKDIEKVYQKKMAKTKDPIKEDKLHLTMTKKVQKIKKGYIEFEGQIIGYDSSLVKTEYTHKNGEGMIVYAKDTKMGRKWDDYYFFINDRLWKIFRAFDAEMFPGLTWTDVQTAMTTKFGANPLQVKKFDPDTKLVKITGLQWQDDKTLLTLLDYTTFYGIFCLRFEDKDILSQIDTLRVNKPPEKSGASVVDAITEGTSADGAENIVDQLKKKYKKKKGSKGGDDSSLPTPKKEDEGSILDDI